MAKIEITDPKALGKKLKFSIEDLFEVFGESIKSAATLNPLFWLEGIGIVVSKLGKLKVEPSLEGKTYLWVFRSLAAALTGVIRNSDELKGIPVNGAWYDSNRDRFEGMFAEIPLVVDDKFLREPVQSLFLKKYFDEFEAWAENVLGLDKVEGHKLRAYYQYLFVNELWEEVKKGECKEVINYIRHDLKVEELQSELRINYRKRLHRFYHSEVMLEKKMRLADIYIEPDFYVHADCLPEKDPRKEQLIRTETTDKKTWLWNPDYSGGIHTYMADFFAGIDPLELRASQPPRFMILLGHPGQGKSSFCKRLLHDICENTYQANQPVFFIRLRDITRVKDLLIDPGENLSKWIREEEAKWQKEYFEFSAGEFSDAVWVLDGLAMRGEITESGIDQFCADLAKISRHEHGPTIILTSRLGYINAERIRWKDTVVLELGKLSQEQQIGWLERYRQFHPGKDLNLDAEIIADINQARAGAALFGVKGLLEQAILLHMVVTSGVDLTEVNNGAQLYKSLFDELVAKVAGEDRDWDKGNLPLFDKVSETKLRKFLRELALIIFQVEGESITKEELLAQSAMKKFPDIISEKEEGASLKNVLVAFYFQSVEEEQKGGAAYEFLHKSFQEYLTAERIWKCFEELGEKSREGELIVEDGIKVLQSLYPILSPKPITIEIRTFILEIVSGMRQDILFGVYEQMVRFAKPLFESQFLLKFDGTEEKGPLHRMANVSYVYVMLLFEISRCLKDDHAVQFPKIPGVLLGLTAMGHPLPLYLRGGGGSLV